MALTDSTMLPLGTKAPDFTLFDVTSGTMKSLVELKSNVATMIVFICNHCPFVIHINPELVRLAKDYQSKGISIIAISSNDIEKYPMDSPSKMKDLANHFEFTFPYLFDETQEVAKAFDAACTPDFYVFDADLKLVYRGRLDESRPSNGKPLNGSDIRNVFDAILNHESISPTQFPSAGCNIKWK
jgi:peroxiredoxin